MTKVQIHKGPCRIRCVQRIVQIQKPIVLLEIALNSDWKLCWNGKCPVIGTYLPGLCVANKAPADTEVTRKLLTRFPLNASQSIEVLNNTRADVFLS